jgi:hypothetical protein
MVSSKIKAKVRFRTNVLSKISLHLAFLTSALVGLLLIENHALLLP